MQLDIPTWVTWSLGTIIGLVSLIITIVGAYGFVVYVRAKNTDAGSDALKESNEALRKLMEDKEKQWTAQIETIHRQLLDSAQQIGVLQGKVEKLERENGEMQNLILQSLTAFWRDNPEIAARVNSEIVGRAGKKP